MVHWNLTENPSALTPLEDVHPLAQSIFELLTLSPEKKMSDTDLKETMRQSFDLEPFNIDVMRALWELEEESYIVRENEHSPSGMQLVWHLKSHHSQH